MSAPHETRTESGHPVIGWKEGEIEIPAQRQSFPGFNRYHLDLVWLATLETRVCGEQILNPVHDGARREESCRTHGLELTLTRPVGDASEMVDVAVADYDRGHCRQRAVGAACVESKMKLRQQYHGAVSSARSTDDGQLSPRGIKLETTELRLIHLVDCTRKKPGSERLPGRSTRSVHRLSGASVFLKLLAPSRLRSSPKSWTPTS